MTRKTILGVLVVTLMLTTGLAAVGSAATTDAGDASTAATSSAPLAQETTEAETETENATASVTFEDQQLNDSSIVVAEINLSEGGFVAVFSQDGDLLGNSSYLESGEHANVTVELNGTLEREQVLVVTPHMDTNGNETFDFNATQAAEVGPANATDRPYMENDVPISEVALVSVGNETTQRSTGSLWTIDARLSADS
jgi:hypothetical protein